MLLFRDRVQAVCPKSIVLGVYSGSLIKPSALLILRWVEPIGPRLVRLEPNCDLDNLASGIPFQPMFLCKFGKLFDISELNLFSETVKIMVIRGPTFRVVVRFR